MNDGGDDGVPAPCGETMTWYFKKQGRRRPEEWIHE